MNKSEKLLKLAAENFLDKDFRSVGNSALGGVWSREEAKDIAKKYRGKVVRQGKGWTVAVFDR